MLGSRDNVPCLYLPPHVVAEGRLRCVEIAAASIRLWPEQSKARVSVAAKYVPDSGARK